MAASKIAEREPEHPNSGNFLRDIVFGANDGVVTAIGFLVGIAASVSNQQLIVVAGFLEIITGAVSMALGNYLAVKSQKEYYNQMERIEKWEMVHKPDVERDEIREIYQNMGFGKEEVEKLTEKVTSDPKLWLDVMMKDELGLTRQEAGNPMLSGIIIGIFYLLGGIPPLLPFIFVHPVTNALMTSVMAAIFVMASIGFIRWFLNKGSLKSKVTETIIIGLVAAFIGYLAGWVLVFFGLNVSI